MRPRIALSLSEVLKSQFLLNFFDPCKEFPETVNPSNLSLCFRERNRGIAEPDASRNAVGDAALRRNHSSVADFDMARYANLAPHDNALAYTRAA
jgi:hypothetical protein